MQDEELLKLLLMLQRQQPQTLMSLFKSPVVKPPVAYPVPTIGIRG